MHDQITTGKLPNKALVELTKKLDESETKYLALKRQHQVVKDSKRRKHIDMEKYRQENNELRQLLEDHQIVYVPNVTT